MVFFPDCGIDCDECPKYQDCELIVKEDKMKLLSVNYKWRKGYPNDPVIQITGKFDIGTIVFLNLQKGTDNRNYYYQIPQNKKSLIFFTLKEAKEYAKKYYVELIDKHFSKILKDKAKEYLPESFLTE